MSTGALQDGWTHVKLGDVATRTSKRCTPELSADVRWIGADHLDEGDLSVRRWSTTDDPMFPPTFYFAVPSGSVLVHSRNPKKVAILPFDAITGEKLFCLAPTNPSALDSRFLAYQLQSDHFHEFVGRWLSGSVNKFLNWTALERYEFALPPLDEQKRIAGLVGAIDRSAGSAESQVLRFQTLILSLVHETLFRGSGGTTSLRPLAELLVMASAGSWGVDAGSGDSDCMVIRSTEFTNIGALASVPPAIRGMSSKELAKLELRTGDILVERSGGTEDRPVGRVISWPGGPSAVPSNFVHLLRVDERAVPSSVLKWTLWYLHQVGATREFQTASTNMRNLRIKAYLQQLVPVLPFAEAVTLGRTIEAADEARRIENERVADLRALRAQVLSAVLGGGDVH